MKRKIISIDQEKCNGCGLCVSDCPEGALRIVDGKARLVGDLLCDGLGACMQSCPQGAISVEEREAVPYDEIRVLENIIPQGRNVLQAHLEHLNDHGQWEYLGQAEAYLRKNGIGFESPRKSAARKPAFQCPGSQSHAFEPRETAGADEGSRPSRLTHWPIQLHLISPAAVHFQNSDLLVAADCAAFSHGDFHKDFLKGKTLVIACPKLDAGQEAYRQKLTALIDEAGVKSISVVIMQVPCCNGLLRHVMEAAAEARRRVPIRCMILGLQGQVLRVEDMPQPAGAERLRAL